jgi:hypothetical protein
MNPWLSLPLSIASLLVPFVLGYLLRAVRNRDAKVGRFGMLVIRIVCAAIPTGMMGFAAYMFGAQVKQAMEMGVFFFLLGFLSFDVGRQIGSNKSGKPNQSTDPTLASGTSRAGHEPHLP